MSDYPRNLVVPAFINPWLRWSIGTLAGRLNALPIPGASQTWTANVAIYIPLLVDWPYNVRRMFWCNGSAASGNSDVGLYTLGGARLWSAGSTACSGAGVPQYVTVSPDIVLQPGQPYFMAFAHDVATASNIFGVGGATFTAAWGRACGVYQQASAFPLPAQATFAAYAAVGLPLVGITNTTTGF
jgi:hypothetical protein